MTFRNTLFASLLACSSLISLHADSVIYVDNANRSKKLEGSISKESSDWVVLSVEGKEIILTSLRVKSLSRTTLPEPLLLAYREALLSLNDNSKKAAAIKSLTDISKNKTLFKNEWVREYALRYILDLQFASADLDASITALSNLLTQFPKSRQGLYYHKKICLLALEQGETLKFLTISNQIAENHGRLGVNINIYYKYLQKIQQKKYKDGKRSLNNYLTKILPKIADEKGKMTLAALELKGNAIASYGYCLAKLGEIKAATEQQVELKKFVTVADDRFSGLYDLNQAEIDLHSKKNRKAYYGFVKVIAQYPHERDIHVKAIVSAIAAATKMNMTKEVGELNKKLARIYPKYKK